MADTMKQGTRQAAVNEYTQEEWRSGFSYRLLLVAMWLLGALGFVCSALRGAFGFLPASILAPARRSHQDGRPSQLILTLDKAVGSLNLVMANRSRTEVWAEEVRVNLIDVDTAGERCTPAQVVLKIRDFVAPSETLHISLINTVYNAAGRPQGVYSCIISAVLRYRIGGADEKEFDQPIPSYRASMIALVPISLRRMGRLDKPARPQRPEDIPSRDRGEQSKRVRRSQRVTAQSAVVVAGRFSDGSAFSESTHALVLSAHGCLVNLPKPVEIGESVVLRNVGTLQERRCQVVYIGGTQSGEIQAGLGFEMEAPEFWGIDCLPSIGAR